MRAGTEPADLRTPWEGTRNAPRQRLPTPTTPFWWTVTVEHPDPAPVDTAPAGPEEIAGTVLVPGAAWWTMPLLVQAALPVDADPADAAQVLADAVGRWTLMAADVGYTPVVPSAAADPRIVDSPLQPSRDQQLATYFVRLAAPSTGQPDPATIFSHVDLVWATAWKHHYGLSGPQKPVFIPIAADQFAIGYTAAQTCRTSRRSR